MVRRVFLHCWAEGSGVQFNSVQSVAPDFLFRLLDEKLRRSLLAASAAPCAFRATAVCSSCASQGHQRTLCFRDQNLISEVSVV